MRIKKSYRFTNWGGNYQSRPVKYFQPESEEDIVEIIQEARLHNKKIRTVGSGHSWSAIACSDDYMINLDLYNKVLAINKETMQVTVQAGLKLKHLNKILETNGLSLVTLGSISEQSVAGATATGTHGTGIDYGIISTQIIRMKVIKSTGESLEIRVDDDRIDAFRVSLGTLGIITEITLQCTTLFNLEEIAFPLPFDKAVETLPEIIKSGDHVKLWWFPHVDSLMVYQYQRTETAVRPFSLMQRWFKESFMAQFVFTTLLRTGVLFPARIPAINRFIKRLHFKKINRIDTCYNVFNVPMPPRHLESEYAIPVESASQALKELKEAIDRHSLKINFVVEVRFVKADNCLLSPAYGRDSCYLGAYLYGNRGWKEYLQVFEELMMKYGGRPHWGKEFTLTKDRLEKLYPQYGKFLDLRNQLDPDRMFSNTFIERVIGL